MKIGSNKPVVLEADDPTSTYSPSCFLCRHWHRNTQRTCNAFSQGIPSFIWSGEHNHQTPVEGDNDIQFEKVTREEIAVDPDVRRLLDDAR